MSDKLQAGNAAAIGAALWDSADWAGAARHFERALHERPREWEALFGLGRLRLAENDLAAAAFLLEQALAVAEALPTASAAELVRRSRRELAWCLYRLDRFDLAAAQWGSEPEEAALVAQWQAAAAAPPYRLTGAGEEIALPFLGTDPLPIVTLVLGGREHAFVLDSGSGPLLLDQELAAELQLPDFGSRTARFASGGSAPVGHTLLPELGLGDATLHNIPAETLPLRRVAPQISGFVGTNLLQRFHVLCDWEGQVLRLRPRQPRPRDADDHDDPAPWAALRSAMTAVPLRFMDGHLLLAPAQLNGQPTMAYLATGMAGTAFTVSEPFARQAALLRPGSQVAGVGAGGEVALEGSIAPRLCLGDWCRSEVEGLVGFFPEPLTWRYGFHVGLLIGHAFLRQRRMLLDFDRMTMWLA